ncbi:MAG: hypothetical protein WCK90_02025 [archaeon]
MRVKLNKLYSAVALSSMVFASGCVTTQKQRFSMAYDDVARTEKVEADSMDNINSADRLKFREVLGEKAFSFYHSGKTAATIEGNEDIDKRYLTKFMQENGIQYIPDYKGYLDKYSGKRLSYPDLTDRLVKWKPR